VEDMEDERERVYNDDIELNEKLDGFEDESVLLNEWV